ncbi:MAG: HAD family hydrolase [Nostoc sp. TH1S01]|nr:HAD family hydrolase [Nostoc sp. TH1S01]
MPAVFIDKDGTLIEDVPYNVDPQLMRLTTGAIEGLQLLSKAGYKLIIITNQSGVARGYFPESSLVAVEARLSEVLAEGNLLLDGFYYCPHHPNGVVSEYAIDCDCRKPKPGLILRAVVEHNIDLQNSWLIGDSLSDVEAGKLAGCKTILIAHDHKPNLQMSHLQIPHHIASTLSRAAQIILYDEHNFQI